MTHINNIASEKQKRMLAYIEQHCEVTFNGNTKKDVFDFIGEWYPKAQMMAKLDAMVNNYSVPVYKMHCNADTNWKWEEDYNLPRDGIAHERLKGSIIRGEDSLTALARFKLEASLEEKFQHE